ncbi:HAD-IC family P-type ATPase [Lapidilactobacillus luobeiensis]|uniref:HAD-IC family P-type ATPase n=1 Tax=Lapidilactobacillus luobeiensis TaxID=2950371 RepID=UPI0021C2A6CF|nr:HAD-IC family P-type ATPase [Lapidilactobacillus luobeiensis]
MAVSQLEQQYWGSGLDPNEVAEQRSQSGRNQVELHDLTFGQGVLRRLWNPTSWLLEAAMICEFLLGKRIQAGFVLALLLFSAIDGELMATKAKRELQLVRQQVQLTVRTLRQGTWQWLDAQDLVRGDIVHVRVGDVLTADLKLIIGAVILDEAALTGESQGQDKFKGDSLYAGSVVRQGEAIGAVTAVGSASRYGRTIDLIKQHDAPGHLQKLLLQVVRYLAILDAFLAVLLLANAVWEHMSLVQLFPFLVILVIATIPISMPASFTVANAVEAKHLAREQILVTGLTAIQEAAAMDVLLVDKTGTLTKGELSLRTIVPFCGQSQRDVLTAVAATTDYGAHDQVSQALIKSVLAEQVPVLPGVELHPFSADHRYAQADLTKVDGSKCSYLLGSTILMNPAVTLTEPELVKSTIATWTAAGSTVLVLIEHQGLQTRLLALLELASIVDPHAALAVQQLQQQGVKVLMLTGDTPATARTIANEVGLKGAIYDQHADTTELENFDWRAGAGAANMLPEDKLAFVLALQQQGHTVGMLGDGVNDGPALKQANVGIAVSGATAIAKKSARVVLTRDQLTDVSAVIASGHRVYSRMLTWTITKLSRTAQLATLLTVGYLMTGFFPVSLNLIVFIVIMNDLVTLVLGTDRTRANTVPEQWDLRRLLRRSGKIATVWVLEGLLYFIELWHHTELSEPQLSSVTFLFLISSALLTILITRRTDRHWRPAPSRAVVEMIVLDLLLTLVMVGGGLFTAAIIWPYMLGTLLLTLVTAILLKYWLGTVG